MLTGIYSLLACSVLAGTAAFVSPESRAADVYDAAVQHAGRSGFKLVGKSDLLRRPDDKRELVSYTPPGLGKTDRFLLVFRKKAG